MFHRNYQKKKDSHNIFYRLLRRHQEEAVALHLESRYTTLLKRRRVFYNGRWTKTGIAKKCVGLKPVSPKKCQRLN